ncbi:hypothetical protein H4Q32_024245 [Labeo rohita]|uniref:Tyr recombinase domain-containing protein n=1 Tax=Labeo rohita TaxID=84645 RepID=A0ABQ8LZD7_LABRO|nr:hypothetical protein H4Q32_024245 [Labeo rohita]
MSHLPAISYSGANTDSSLCMPLTSQFGQAQVDFFASPESTHCQLWYGLTEAPLGTDALAHSFPRYLLAKYAFPHVSLIAQTLCKVREDKGRTQGDVASNLCYPSSEEAWIGTCLPQHSVDLVEGRSVGKHDLVIRFLRGSQRLNPPRLHLIPSWDLAVVLQALQQDPFEPLQSVDLSVLSMKMALLTGLTSVKRVPTTPFRDQVVTLQAIPSQEGDPNRSLLCPVRALRIYAERIQAFRRSEQLFVCSGGQQKGKAVSKQKVYHWLVVAICMAYKARGLPCPLGVRAHSTRGVAASAVFVNGASLTDICRASGWATPNTFARFYNLLIKPVSSLSLERKERPSCRTLPTGQVLRRWKVTKRLLSVPDHSGNGDVVSFIPQLQTASDLVETLLHSSEQNKCADPVLPYLYLDVRAWPSMQNLHTQFHWPFLNVVRGVWAPMSDP